MADREDMYLVIDRFVHDAVWAAENMTKPVSVCGDLVETFEGDGGSEKGKVPKTCGCCPQVTFPPKAIIGRKHVGDSDYNVI